MSSKVAYDNPMLGQSGDITMDPDVLAITSKCPNWKLDPPIVNMIDAKNNNNNNIMGYNVKTVKDLLGNELCNKPLRVTFRSKTLAGGKRPNWMRTTAFLGNDENDKSKPVRAVWTCSNVDADTSMTFEEVNSSSGRNIKKEIGKNVLEDSYEDCLKRLYGKYVELEVLLPRNRKKGEINGAGPPASLVYRVPITKGQVNPFGMVSKSRATVTLYPKGRTLAAANASGRDALNAPRDLAVPLGLTNVHLPLGPGLVDPSWARGRKVFWKGRSVGLV